MRRRRPVGLGPRQPKTRSASNAQQRGSSRNSTWVAQDRTLRNVAGLPLQTRTGFCGPQPYAVRFFPVKRYFVAVLILLGSRDCSPRAGFAASALSSATSVFTNQGAPFLAALRRRLHGLPLFYPDVRGLAKATSNIDIGQFKPTGTCRVHDSGNKWHPSRPGTGATTILTTRAAGSTTTRSANRSANRSATPAWKPNPQPRTQSASITARQLPPKTTPASSSPPSRPHPSAGTAARHT